jgi:thioredoxin 2
MTTKQTEAAIIVCGSCAAVNRVPVKRLKENPLCGKCKALLDFPMSTIKVTEATFEKETATWPEAALVYFWARECEACRTVESVVDDIAFLRAGRIKVLKVEVTSEPALAERFSIRGTPVFLIFRNNFPIARLDGAPREKIELLQWIEQQIGTTQ